MLPALAPGADIDCEEEAADGGKSVVAGCGVSFDLAAEDKARGASAAALDAAVADDKGHEASAAAADATWLAGGAVC